MAEAAAGLRGAAVVLAAAVLGSALSLLGDWRLLAAAAASAVVVAGALWTVARPWRWCAGFAAASLLLPPLPLSVGGTGAHPALVFAACGLAAAVRLGFVSKPRAPLETASFTFAAVIVASCGWAWVYSGWTVAVGSAARAGLWCIAVFGVWDLSRGAAGRTAPDLAAASHWLFRFGGLTALWACVDFLLQIEPLPGFAEQFVWTSTGYVRRAQGVFYDAGQLGNVCSFFLIGLAAAAVRAPAGLIRRWEPAAAAATLTGALLFSFSRASILHLASGLFALVLLHRGSLVLRRAAGAGAVGFAAALSAALVLAPEFMRSYGERLSHSLLQAASDPVSVLGERWETWQALAEFFAAHPERLVFGVGYKTLAYVGVRGDPLIVDNAYVSVLAETGVLGLAALTALLVAVFAASARLARYPDAAVAFVGVWSLCFWIFFLL